jgi:hypothetical protein
LWFTKLHKSELVSATVPKINDPVPGQGPRIQPPLALLARVGHGLRESLGIEGDAMPWEAHPVESLAREGQLSAFRHRGYWHAMDTLRDRMVLEELATKGKAPWMS